MKTRQSTKLSTKNSSQVGDSHHGKASVNSSSVSEMNQKVAAGVDEKAGAPPRRSPRFVSPIGHAKDSTAKSKNE